MNNVQTRFLNSHNSYHIADIDLDSLSDSASGLLKSTLDDLANKKQDKLAPCCKVSTHK